LTYLPPYLADVDPWMGETASDHQYADLTGDILPELRLGRFPVNTPAEVEAIVNKIISYEADPLVGNWNRRLVFGADNPSTAGERYPTLYPKPRARLVHRRRLAPKILRRTRPLGTNPDAVAEAVRPNWRYL